MKKAILFLGVLFCMLMTMPSYAQKTSNTPKENNTGKEKHVNNKSPEMKVMSPEQKKQVARFPKTKVVKKREIFRTFDPITGEMIPNYPSGTLSQEITINRPESQFHYPNSNWFQLENTKITLDGEAIIGHTLEIKMLRALNGEYIVVQDWTAYVVQQNGIWMARIPWDGVTDGQSLILKILIRDTANILEVKTLFMGRK